LNRIRESGKLFEDFDFLPTRKSLYYDDQKPPAYDGDVHTSVHWLRPSELSEEADYLSGVNEEQMVGERGTISDIISTRIDDSFLVSAIASLAIHEGGHLLEKIVKSEIEDVLDHGVFSCSFYKNGSWITCSVDTKLPCSPSADPSSKPLPLYAHSVNKNEFLIPLIEKAYAKVCFVGFYTTDEMVCCLLCYRFMVPTKLSTRGGLSEMP